jgi:hypothetical protein
MSVLRALIIMAIVILRHFTINDYFYGYSQTEYCHEHYDDGTVACHKMPMNMTMPVNEEELKRAFALNLKSGPW